MVTAAVIADVAVEVGAAAPTPNIARDYLLFFFFLVLFVLKVLFVGVDLRFGVNK